MKTREEQVEEMAKAIYATGVALDGTDYAFGVYDDDDHFHRMASALLEAGIGDVSAVKAEQEEIKLFNAEIKNGEIDMTVGSAGFKTFFAIVEQMFKQNGAKAFLTTTIEGGNDTKYAVTIQKVGEKSPAEELRQATELCKHEKHRAEVAEGALVIMAKKVLEYAEKAKVTAMTSDGMSGCEKSVQLANLVSGALLQAEQKLAEEQR